ncbi:hypothetical protein C8R46DRAFT_1198279 [Mycena filopes]|nr:hypothetical protein C8R46DRAFT_1198279 [Mycena filopes]
MFNFKYTVLFSALLASGVVAAPLPAGSALVARACDAATLQTTIASAQSTAQDILNVGFVLPDPLRRNDADVATFDTIVSAINDASTALGASDLATTSSKIGFAADTLRAMFISSLDIADGTESSVDLDLADELADASAQVAACV